MVRSQLWFSHSVMSDSLQLHGLQYISLPCPSLSPRACSNSCPFKKPAFSLSSFTLIKKLFNPSSLFAKRVVSSAYLRLLIFLLALLIPACASSSPAFHMKLNKQGDNIEGDLTYSFPDLEPVCCSMSSSNCCFLTCKQFHRRQVR